MSPLYWLLITGVIVIAATPADPPKIIIRTMGNDHAASFCTTIAPGKEAPVWCCEQFKCDEKTKSCVFVNCEKQP